MPSFLHVDFKLKNVSRQRFPSVPRVPALIFRFVAQYRKSRSDVFVCSGKSGFSSTRNRSAFFAAMRLSADFNSGQVVAQPTMMSKRARSASAWLGVGA